MKVLIDGKDKIIEKKTDSRGRITLGTEYANSKVTLAILHIEEKHSEEEDNIENR